MPQDQLRQSLEQLQAELDNVTLDEATRETLAEIKAQVQALLDEPEADSRSLQDRLRAVVAQFEVEHPALSRALEITANSLSNLGI